MNFKVHKKETIYFWVMVTINLLCVSGFVLHKNFIEAIGFILAIGGILGFLTFIGKLLLMGAIQGNGLKISKQQFPDVFEILVAHAHKLNLPKVPDMYVLQGGGILNAFALKFSRRDYIVLYSDVLALAYKQGIDAVSFIIAHELGHIKRKHTGFKSLILFPANLMPFLGNAYSRACEYTCDNVGYSLCPEGALKGILVLAAGKDLFNKVNIDALLANLSMQKNFSVSLVEFFSTHPALINRIANIYQVSDYNLAYTTKSVFSPAVDFKQFQPPHE
jgi:Zn-dependent protease with chaperone function